MQKFESIRNLIATRAHLRLLQQHNTKIKNTLHVLGPVEGTQIRLYKYKSAYVSRHDIASKGNPMQWA